jgi:cob(I)alamin adenosyltransferase
MTEEHLTQGMIQVYTGDGKGKTTCALGLALRAIGHGFKVYMIQFMKGWETGEAQSAVSRLAPEMTLCYFGRHALVNLRSPAPEDLDLIREGWKMARRIIKAGEHDLVILDEINLVLDHNLLPRAEVLAEFKKRPPWVELVLTGRRAPQELIDLADLVTEMRPIKHYYQAGVPARRGIEW